MHLYVAYILPVPNSWCRCICVMLCCDHLRRFVNGGEAFHPDSKVFLQLPQGLLLSHTLCTLCCQLTLPGFLSLLLLKSHSLPVFFCFPAVVELIFEIGYTCCACCAAISCLLVSAACSSLCCIVYCLCFAVSAVSVTRNGDSMAVM